MAVAFQEDFEAVQNMAEETIFKEPQSVEKAGEHGEGGLSDRGEDDGANDDADDLIDNDRESRKQLKSPLECGFVQTTTKPSVFFKILTDQDIEDREKARQEKLQRAAVEIAQLEARRCAEEKQRLKRRELEQKERRLRALIMDELRSLWKKGHVFQIPEQVDPYLRGECGSDPEENEIRRRLFHGCFYEFCHRLQSSRKRLKNKRHTILETVTWTTQEIELYYECMARHRIPIAYGSPAFGALHCSSQRLTTAGHRIAPPAHGTMHSSAGVLPFIAPAHRNPRPIGIYDRQARADNSFTAGRPLAFERDVRSFREPCETYPSVAGCGNSSDGSNDMIVGDEIEKAAKKLCREPKTPDRGFVDELLRENAAIDKPENSAEIDLYDDL